MQTSFLWPTPSLDLRQPASGVRGPDSPGGIRAVGHEGAYEQLVSIASGHVQWRVPKFVGTINLAA